MTLFDEHPTCSECGALVGDRELHSNWHKAMIPSISDRQELANAINAEVWGQVAK